MSTTSYAEASACRFCGNHHGPRCPEVKAIEYHPDGTVKRVEFIAPALLGTFSQPQYHYHYGNDPQRHATWGGLQGYAS